MLYLICEGYLIQSKVCSEAVKIRSRTDLDLAERMRRLGEALL